MSNDLENSPVQQRDSTFEKIRRFLFGNDVFISYSRVDSTYALTLANELTKKGLSCFLDQWGTPPGEQLPQELIKNIKDCSTMVLVGSKHAAESENVGLEVKEFLETRRPIIPITFVADRYLTDTAEDFNPQNLKGTLENSDWYDLIKGIAKTTDTLSALNNKKPSENVIIRVFNAAQFRSRSRRLRKTFFATLAGILILLLVGSLAVYRAFAEVSVAQEKTRQAEINAGIAADNQKEAESKLSDAQKNLSNINQSLADTKNQLAKAGTDLTSAKTQLSQTKDDLLTAQTQTEEARKQTEAAENQLAVAKVEAEKLTDRNKKFRYAVDMKVINSSVEGRNYSQSRELLEGYLPPNNSSSKFTDLRGFEWYYLWNRYHEDLATVNFNDSVKNVAVSRQANRIASFSDDGSISLYDAQTLNIIGNVKFRESGFKPRFLDFSPDGKTLVAADDNAVRFWDVASDKESETVIEGICQNCQNVKFSPGNNDTLLVQSNGSIIVWDIKKKIEIKRIQSDWLRTLFKYAVSDDGNLLAASFGNGTVELHNLKDKEPVSIIKPSTGFGRQLVFIPGKKILAVTVGVNMNEGIEFFDVSNPANAQRTDSMPLTNKSRISSMNVSPDGESLAIGYDNKIIELWDIDRKKWIKNFTGHSDSLGFLEFPSNDLLISSAGNSIKLWDVAAGASEVSLQDISRIKYPLISFLSFSPDGNDLITGGAAYSIVRYIDVVSKRENLAFEDQNVSDGYVTGLAISPTNKNFLAVGTGNGYIKLKNLDTGSENFLPPPQNKTVVNLKFIKNGKTLAAVYVNGRDIKDRLRERKEPVLSLYDLSSGQNSIIPLLPQMFSGNADLLNPTVSEERIESAVFATSHSFFLTAGNDGCYFCFGDSLKERKGIIRLWKISSGSVESAKTFEIPMKLITGISLSKDDKFIAVGLENGAVKIIDVETFKEIAVLTGHADMVAAVEFSPDGKTLATSSRDHTIKLWSLDTMQEVLTLNSEKFYDLLAFSPDGKKFASASYEEGYIKFW